jgi:hypothetical protein
MLAARRLLCRSFTTSARARPVFPTGKALALLSLGPGIWLAAEPERLSLLRANLEAAVRAARLLATCVAIARDYNAAREWEADDMDDDQVRALHEEHNRWQELAGAAEYVRAQAQSEGGPALAAAGAEAARTRERAMALGEQLAAARLLRAETSGLAARWEEVHTRNAERLHALCRANGGLYVKLGQHIAQLDYIVPQAYTRALSRLFQHTAASSTADVVRIIEEDIGRPLSDCFAHFEPLPLASASLAQVHAAVEHGTGRKLAVKVQHARLREACASDIAAVRTAVDVASWLYPAHFRLRWVLDELAPYLPLELDFENEANNLRRCAAFLRGSRDLALRVAVPGIVPQLSSRRVLCMTLEDGCSVTDLPALHRMRLSPVQVSSLLCDTFCSLVFDGGFCHCDPHPGNVLVRARPDDNTMPQLVLLDHGLYRLGGGLYVACLYCFSMLAV